MEEILIDKFNARLNKRVYVTYDDVAESPREWDSLFTLVWEDGVADVQANPLEYMSKLSDEEIAQDIDSKDFLNETVPKLEKQNDIIVFPVVKGEGELKLWYEVGARRGWGEVPIGLAYVEKEKLERKGLNSLDRNELRERLDIELDKVSQWANDEVYAYTITDHYGEIIDSVGGFYENPEYVLGFGMEEAGDSNENNWSDTDVAYIYGAKGFAYPDLGNHLRAYKQALTQNLGNPNNDFVHLVEKMEVHHNERPDEMEMVLEYHWEEVGATNEEPISRSFAALNSVMNHYQNTSTSARGVEFHLAPEEFLGQEIEYVREENFRKTQEQERSKKERARAFLEQQRGLDR